MAYSYQGEKEKTARALARNINVSWKQSNEVCYNIKNKKLDKAIDQLNRVLEKKEFIPHRRYKTGIGHRKKGKPGRWPIKATEKVRKLLENAKSNAENTGLDTEKLKIVHATAYKTTTAPRTKPKGRARPHNIELTNIEIVVKEV